MADTDFEIAKSHFLAGVSYLQNENWEQAEASFRLAQKILPGRSSTVSNLLGALVAQEKYDEAWEIVDDALALNEDHSNTNANVGILHYKSRNYDEALSYLNKAIHLDDKNFAAFLNKGKVLMEFNKIDEAIWCFEKSLELKPANVDGLMFKSFACLVSGEFSDGWALYENRWDWIKTTIKREYEQSLWLGDADLTDKTIMLHWEQGLGDTIQFSRYAAEVKKLGCKVVLEVQKPVYTLLKQLDGVDQVVAAGDPLPAFDYYCSLMSLPFALGTTMNKIPPPTGPLHAGDRKISTWQKRLGPKAGLRVGIVWSGNPDHPGDRNRSLSLHQFLTALPDDCDVISLQKVVREEDEVTLQEADNVRHFGAELTDFTDTAALCELVDVVVSVDTSVAHLAGTLERPVFVLLPYKPDFRWMLNRADSPWYPSMTLCRQGDDRSWSPVLASVKLRLMSMQ